MIRKIFAFATIAIILFASAAFAQIPDKISYQGYLTDAGGNAVNGTVNLGFTIYDAETGGASVWSENHVGVNVTDGVFNVILGSQGGTSLSTLDFDEPYYVGISINGGADLSPRTPFTTSPYSFYSSNAETAETVADASISSSKIQDGAIVNSKIAADAITEDEILDGSVTGDKIYAGAITVGKLSTSNTAGASTDGYALVWDNDAASMVWTNLANDNPTFGTVTATNGMFTNLAVNEGEFSHLQLDGNDVVTDATSASGDLTGDFASGFSVTSVQTAAGSSVLAALNATTGDLTVTGDLVVTGEVDPISVTYMPQTTAPTHVEGKLYYDGNTDMLYLSDGSAWNPLQTGTEVWSKTGANAYYNAGFVGVGTSSPGYPLEVSGTSFLDGDAYVTGNSEFDGTVEVDGAVDLNNTLNVDGASVLNSTLYVLGNATMSNDLDVTSDATIGHDLDVGADVQVDGSLTVDSYTTLNGTMNMNAISYFNYIAHFTDGIDAQNYIYNSTADYITVSDDLNVSGKVDVAENVEANAIVLDQRTSNPTAVEGTIYYNTTSNTIYYYDGSAWQALGGATGGGGTSVWSTSGSDAYYTTGNVGIGLTNPTYPLHVSGQSYLGGNAQVWGNLDVNGAFTAASGTLTALNIYGPLSATGNSTFGANLAVTGALDVDGTTELDGLNVDGATTVDALDVSGDITDASDDVVTVDDNLDVTGALGVYGGTTIYGVTNAQSDAYFHGDLSVGMDLDVDGATTLNGTLDVDGATTLHATLVVDGQADFGGDVNIAGDLNVTGEIDPVAVTYQPQTSAPTAAEGKLYYNATTDALNVYDGTQWVELGSGGTSLWTENGANVGRASGNVGIGTTTPGYTLEVVGNGYFDSYVVVDGYLDVNGTASFTNAEFSGSADVAGSVYANALVLDQRTSNPTAVEGTIYYNTTSNTIYYYDGTTWQALGGGSGGGGGSSVWTASGSDIYFDAGKVGIGTTTPSVDLHVNGDIGNDKEVVVNGELEADLIYVNRDGDYANSVTSLDITGKAVFNNDFISYGNGDIRYSLDLGLNNFGTANTSLAVYSKAEFLGDVDIEGDIVNDYGDVTVNDNFVVAQTTELQSTLDVQGNISNSSGAVQVNDANGFVVTGDVDFNDNLNVDGATALGSTLDVTGAADFASTLDVDGAATLNSTLNVVGNTTLAGTLHVTGTNASRFDGLLGLGIDATTYRLELPNNGDASIGKARANAWDTYSDGRVKTDFEDIHYGLAQVLKIAPKTYNHHSSEFVDGKLVISDEYERTFGFVAQELYDVIPEAVSKPSNEDEALWGVNYDKLVPVLVKAVQEQQLQIEQLKAELNRMQKNAQYGRK